MKEPSDDASQILRAALAAGGDRVDVRLKISPETARNLLTVLEAEQSSGVVVVPVKELYTTTESAAMLGLSRASLMKLIESGEVNAVKVGTHHRVPAHELLTFQRARQVSRDRTAELVTEFSSRAADFHSNVSFLGGKRGAQNGARQDGKPS